MTSITTNLTRFDGTGLNAVFVQLRDRHRARAAQRAVYRQAVRELNAASDRELADLGFHRSEIPRIAQEAVDQL